MTIVMQMHWPEVSTEQYHQAREVVGWETDRPAGARLHVAWMADDGFHVWDVWDSAEQFNTFVENRLQPGVAQVGIDGQPKVEIVPCHAHQVEQMPGAGGVVEVDMIPTEAYDALRGQVDWVTVPPVGGIAHIAAEVGDGMLQTLSVWTTPAAHHTFEDERLVPGAQALGMELPPEDEPTVFHPLIRLYDAVGARAGG